MERKEYEKMFNSFSNISNANINPRYFEDFAIVQRAIYTLRDEINAAEKLISDHKAVVEKMQNKIDELEKLKSCDNCDEEPEKGQYKEICHSCTRNMNYQNPECCEDNWIVKGIK